MKVCYFYCVQFSRSTTVSEGGLPFKDLYVPLMYGPPTHLCGQFLEIKIYFKAVQRMDGQGYRAVNLVSFSS